MFGLNDLVRCGTRAYRAGGIYVFRNFTYFYFRKWRKLIGKFISHVLLSLWLIGLDTRESHCARVPTHVAMRLQHEWAPG